MKRRPYIEHLAIWAGDLEKLKEFYHHYFQARVGSLYCNPAKNFSSYFLRFRGGSRLELMHRSNLFFSEPTDLQESCGLAHLAFRVENKARVLELTEELRRDGIKVASEARLTGDGYFESCILDPEGNRVEIIFKSAS